MAEECRVDWESPNGRELTPGLCRSLMALRPPLPATIGRAPAEMGVLLTIPDAALAVARGPGGMPIAYAVMGRGQDMAGVVHEWGATQPRLVLAAAYSLARRAGLETVTVLAPDRIEPAWNAALAKDATLVETHRMALAWTAPGGDATRALLERGFVWGLDSI